MGVCEGVGYVYGGVGVWGARVRVRAWVRGVGWGVYGGMNYPSVRHFEMLSLGL